MGSWHQLSGPPVSRTLAGLRSAMVPCGLLAVTLALSAVAAAQRSPAPPDLVALEKQVSLKITHVRLEGPTNAADLRRLAKAQGVEMEGEKAMAAGDYKAAEQDFLRANVIISGGTDD